MTYGSASFILLEVGFPTIRTDQFDNNRNEQLRFTSLDLIEERRELTAIKLAHYQQRLTQGYDKGIETRAFMPGDLVLMKVVRNVKHLS